MCKFVCVRAFVCVCVVIPSILDASLHLSEYEPGAHSRNEGRHRSFRLFVYMTTRALWTPTAVSTTSHTYCCISSLLVGSSRNPKRNIQLTPLLGYKILRMVSYPACIPRSACQKNFANQTAYAGCRTAATKHIWNHEKKNIFLNGAERTQTRIRLYSKTTSKWSCWAR